MQRHAVPGDAIDYKYDDATQSLTVLNEDLYLIEGDMVPIPKRGQMRVHFVMKDRDQSGKVHRVYFLRPPSTWQLLRAYYFTLRVRLGIDPNV